MVEKRAGRDRPPALFMITLVRLRIGLGSAAQVWRSRFGGAALRSKNASTKDPDSVFLTVNPFPTRPIWTVILQRKRSIGTVSVHIIGTENGLSSVQFLYTQKKVK